MTLLNFEGLSDMNMIAYIDPFSHSFLYYFLLLPTRYLFELLHGEDGVLLLEDRVGR